MRRSPFDEVTDFCSFHVCQHAFSQEECGKTVGERGEREREREGGGEKEGERGKRKL